MNKKVLLIVAALLAVSLVVTPLLAGARKTKADLTIFGYNLQQVVADMEVKQVGSSIVERTHWIVQLVVLGPAVDQGMLPMYGGTSDGWLTKKFDPVTGFGKVRSESTYDFGEYGSFKVFGLGKCGGKVPGTPLVAWVTNYHAYGFGRGALKGVRLEFISFPQIDLPDMPVIPPDYVDTLGFCAVGEIIY